MSEFMREIELDNENFCIKIGDLGLSKELEPDELATS